MARLKGNAGRSKIGKTSKTSNVVDKTAVGAENKVKKSVDERARQGTKALRELRLGWKLPSIPNSPFRRVVNGIVRDLVENEGCSDPPKLEESAMEMIQEAAENVVTELLGDCRHIAKQFNRDCINPKDVALALRIRGRCLVSRACSSA
jgi:histone H3/H4